MDLPTLQAAIDAPTPSTRAVLFAHLANSKSAARAKAAEGLLRLYARARHRTGLARDFGSEPEAILLPVMDELRDLIAEPRTPAWTRFVNSLVLDVDAWRDGTGYDIAALNDVSEPERGALCELFKTRLGRPNRAADWRDLEAAQALGETAVIAALQNDPDAQVRLRAKLLVGNESEVAAELSHIIRDGRDTQAVSRALDHVADHPTEAVKSALIARVSMIDGNFINAAMVLLEVFGGSKDSWDERPFLFEVQAQGAGGALIRQLLARVTTS
jgi:hypothetical protein